MEYNYPITTQLSRKFEWLYQRYDWIILGLLSLIILLPKFQFIPVSGTYINIRVEDFIVLIVYGIWLVGWFGGRFEPARVFNFKILRNYLVYGLFITIIGIFVIGSIDSPQLGILHWLRRVEYFGMFFIVATVAKVDKIHKYLYALLAVGGVTWLYGLLQWQDILPGVHTLSKAGQLGTFSELGYVISTFAAHYDFGAFLMLMIMLSVWGYFSHQKIWKKLMFIGLAFAFWWMSRLVYGRAAYLGTLIGLIAVFAIKASAWVVLPMYEIFLTFDRYFTGKFSKYAYDFKFKFLPSPTQAPTPTPIPFENISKELDRLNVGSDFAQEKVGKSISGGGGFEKPIDLSKVEQTSWIKEKLDAWVNQASQVLRGFFGRFDINLDPSANIRVTEWQDALARVGYNFMWGTGYASMVGVGLDNDYLRKIVEVGVIGLAMFLLIIWDFFRVCWKMYTSLAVPHLRYFHLAMMGFIIGLLVEAVFIDIFEASKIAFTFWYLMGLVAVFVPLRDKRFN